MWHQCVSGACRRWLALIGLILALGLINVSPWRVTSAEVNGRRVALAEAAGQSSQRREVRDLGPRLVVREGKGAEPAFPYYLVLRAGGSVDRVHASALRTFSLSAARPTFMHAFPGEPGYERAEK